MTEILLRRELEPLARQQQRYKLLFALAICWGAVAAVALAAFLLARYLLPLPPSMLLIGVGVIAAVGVAIATRIVKPI